MCPSTAVTICAVGQKWIITLWPLWPWKVGQTVGESGILCICDANLVTVGQWLAEIMRHFPVMTQFSGASSLSLPLSLSRPHTMKFHLISLIFLYLTVHPMFSGHLFLLTSCRSLALYLIFGSRSFRVAAPTVCNSLPDSIRSSNTLNSFRRHLKHTISKLFEYPLAQTPAPLIHLWLTALYKRIYLLTYLLKIQ